MLIAGEVLRGDRIVNTPYEVFVWYFCIKSRQVSQINEHTSSLAQLAVPLTYNIRLIIGLLQVFMKKDVACAVMCDKTVTNDETKLLAKRIEQGYNVHLWVQRAVADCCIAIERIVVAIAIKMSSLWIVALRLLKLITSRVLILYVSLT